MCSDNVLALRRDSLFEGNFPLPRSFEAAVAVGEIFERLCDVLVLAAPRQRRVLPNADTEQLDQISEIE